MDDILPKKTVSHFMVNIVGWEPDWLMEGGEANLSHNKNTPVSIHFVVPSVGRQLCMVIFFGRIKNFSLL